MSEVLCRHCRFWCELPVGDPMESGPYKVTGIGTGLCRRYPPVGLRPLKPKLEDTADVAGAAGWPITWNFDWCGEFVPDLDRR